MRLLAAAHSVHVEWRVLARSSAGVLCGPQGCAKANDCVPLCVSNPDHLSVSSKCLVGIVEESKTGNITVIDETVMPHLNTFDVAPLINHRTCNQPTK
jgi:hypothetical protein